MTDDKCLLEYSTNEMNPTCVPSVNTMHNMNLSQHDVDLMRTIFARLLPDEDSFALTLAMESIHRELFPHIMTKLKAMITQTQHSSWQSLVQTVAENILVEINQTICPICQDELNGSADGDKLMKTPCCPTIYHRRCMGEYLASRPSVSCPTCTMQLDYAALGYKLSFISRVARLSSGILQSLALGAGGPYVTDLSIQARYAISRFLTDTVDEDVFEVWRNNLSHNHELMHLLGILIFCFIVAYKLKIDPGDRIVRNLREAETGIADWGG